MCDVLLVRNARIRLPIFISINLYVWWSEASEVRVRSCVVSAAEAKGKSHLSQSVAGKLHKFNDQY